MNWNILAGKAINGDDIINQLFPNIPMLIAHVFATLILLLVLWRWVYKPFRTLLHNRHLNIKGKLDDAAVKQALANQDRSHALEMLNSAKVEADVIVNDAKTKAYDERKEILDQAHVEAMRITNQSKHDIAKQKKAAEKEIKAEIEAVSLELAKVILNSEIDAKKHQKFIDDFIDKI
ncbi:ATP synthase subunit b, sodium ion specific [Spiroplasma sp. JKS002669]|uniref:F0F1 ATP synthase subunit B n=1 Tax=Spiroplasma attinicola TaxID=2904537 RepID=UPI002022EF06|nr:MULTISPECIES: F0F1 ATP synthase subunit B [unclassified Spiroplasma]MCL6428863.1 ATP synthase subunit b, sodium ion specific [Spiroplasma sp. JKS002669]MCL8210145.1 ATP synthase subunit b, sodium ion specific [Spiroplasma sp. JKS002670]MCL8210653.1 ATP synthase subunit b, sodium ion specific [Spiroplasma sp. JKS002671]